MTGVAILAGVLWAWQHISQPPHSQAGEVPTAIAGVPLMQVITGEEAVRSINRLHGKEFPLVSGAVAVYGEQNVILWVSTAADEAAAGELTRLMTERIAEGRSPFQENGSRKVDGVTVYDLTGLGQRHFYWQSGNLVLWLAADEALAGRALEETIAFYAAK
ncbi:MAG: hypothetical protein D6770_02610 [Anaerolineae bacterium]|nr:MAG: hypothetical protein D6770_02610 [Anaerolineae bacterium]